VVTVIGLLLPRLVGGAVVTETVFSWPGIGRLSVMAAFQRDYPVVMGVTLMVSVVVVLSSLLVDVLYAYLDPRIRLG
jgi:peptide/nickel transport system permease protein